MEKDYIIGEIRRTASENGAVPLGRAAFRRETGIKQSDWYGKYWARWGDALIEAGFSPNQMQQPLAEDEVIRSFIQLIRELGRFPVHGEIRLKARNSPGFPSHTTCERLGSKRQQASKIIAYCECQPGCDDILSVCRPIACAETGVVATARCTDTEDNFGCIYLLKSGRYYKIGKTNAAGRRERELAIQLPERAETAHVIRTDDPTGIEAYWHRRFAEKRKNGEWFALTPEDVAVFRRRKFM